MSLRHPVSLTRCLSLLLPTTLPLYPPLPISLSLSFLFASNLSYLKVFNLTLFVSSTLHEHTCKWMHIKTYTYSLPKIAVIYMHTKMCHAWSLVLTCVIYSSAWRTHMRDILICVTYSSAWYIHLRDIFICVTHSYAWHTHLRDILICVTYSYAWHTHMRDILICLTYSSAWHTHMRDILITNDDVCGMFAVMADRGRQNKVWIYADKAWRVDRRGCTERHALRHLYKHAYIYIYTYT